MNKESQIKSLEREQIRLLNEIDRLTNESANIVKQYLEIVLDNPNKVQNLLNKRDKLHEEIDETWSKFEHIGKQIKQLNEES